MQLKSQSSYVREIRPALSAEAFEPATSRIAFVPVLLVVIAGAIIAIATGVLPWPLVPLVSLVIGAAFAGLTFIARAQRA